MGCAASKTTLVQVRSSELNGDGEDTGSKQGAGRGDSAGSKFTTDSGVVLETGQALVLPGAVPRTLPPLKAAGPGLTHESPAERPRSSEILEQLWSQGLIPSQPGDRPRIPGEMDDREMPSRRPPPRLESLKTQTPPCLPHTTQTQSLGTEVGGQESEGRANSRQGGERSREREERSREREEGSRKVVGGSSDGGRGRGDGGRGSRDGGGVREREREGDLPATSLEMESDDTFQQTEEVEEIF